MRTLRATKPSFNTRYEKLAGVKSFSSSSSPHRPALPPGIYGEPQTENAAVPDWEALTHPEGKLYFYNRSRRIVTESNLIASGVLSEIEESLQLLESVISDFCKEQKDTWPDDCEVFLELIGDETCEYYITSPRHHTVFWISEWGDLLDLLDDASPTTIRLTLEEEFWVHVAFFPIHRVLPTEDEEMLRGILIFTCADQMTAPGSTSYLTAEECRAYLSLLGCTTLPCTMGARTWLIARVMTTITRNRNQNCYGQEGARLDRSQGSIHPVVCPPTFLRRLANGLLVRNLLYNANVEYEKALQLISVDDVVLPQPWKSFMTMCQRDWSTTMGTALLIVLANTVLLAGSVNPGWRGYAARTSIVIALASFALALYQSRAHRELENANAYVAADYLQRAEHKTLGYTPLAIYLCFSYVLGVWAIIIFAIAILLPP